MFIIVTLKNIADICGVSPSTVSRAFDKNSRISQPVRQRILSCASDLGYTPNLIARSLKSNRTMTIALIIPSIENRFYIDVLHYLEITLHHHGYKLLVTFVQNDSTTERDCLEMAASAQVDGMIILSETRENQKYIEQLLKNFKIIQLFNDPYPQIDSVVMNDTGGAEAGTNYLLQKGHKRILYLGGDRRISGFWKAIDDAHILHENVRCLPYPLSVDDVCAEINQFQPTAIFSVATASETAWLAIRRLGLSVPNDISILTYDNSQWVNLVGLTAIAHNLEEITAALVDLLLKRLNDDNSLPVQHLVLEPFIIERNSVKSLN